MSGHPHTLWSLAALDDVRQVLYSASAGAGDEEDQGTRGEGFHLDGTPNPGFQPLSCAEA